MDNTLAWLSSSRSPRSPSSLSPDACKLPARGRRKRNVVANIQSQPQRHQAQNANDAFQSVVALEEVVRLENDACRVQMDPEDAFALLRKVLAPHEVSARGLFFTELLDGIDVACWRTLASENTSAPGSNREATIRSMKETFMAGSTRALDCELQESRRSAKSKEARDDVAASLEDKKQTLRRRRDLRVWACDELREAVNESMTHANELKRAISMLAKRLEGIIASVSESSKSTPATTGGATASDPVVKISSEATVTQGLEKKTRLVEAIEQQKVYLRARTELVFNARNDVRVLEQKKADVRGLH
ncbi:hypothetical protein FI667_g4107, partial [Globisporangium splendens]